MNCSKCGAQLQPGQTFCASCGQPVEQAAQPEMNQNMNGQFGQPGMNQNMNGQFGQPGMNQNMNGQMNGQYMQQGMNQQSYGAPALPMNWYKFVSYFSLPLSALLFLITGISTMTGSQYQGRAYWVYAVYDGMKAVDIMMGIASLALAVLSILACIMMVKKRKNAVKLFLTLLVVSFCVTVLYLIAASAVTGTFLGSVSNITSLIVSAVMFFVNKVYFDKRAMYFVN